jgi:hypothetical protein
MSHFARLSVYLLIEIALISLALRSEPVSRHLDPSTKLPANALLCASELPFTSTPNGLNDRLIAFSLGGWSGFFRWFGPVHWSLRLLGHPAALAASTFEET